MVSRYTGFWAKGQPDYQTGSCVKASTTSANSAPLSNVAWHLEMCNMLFPFVCELPACVKGIYFCLLNYFFFDYFTYFIYANFCGPFNDLISSFFGNIDTFDALFAPLYFNIRR